MQPGEKTKEDIKIRIGGLLDEHWEEIGRVFGRETEITINVPVKLSMEEGKIKNVVSIKYVVEKREDTSTGMVDETQLPLFEEPMVPCPITDGETRTVKYCNNQCGLRRMQIFVRASDAEPDVPFVQYRSCRMWTDHDTKAFIADMLSRCPDLPAKEEGATVYKITDKKRGRKKAARE